MSVEFDNRAEQVFCIVFVSGFNKIQLTFSGSSRILGYIPSVASFIRIVAMVVRPAFSCSKEPLLLAMVRRRPPLPRISSIQRAETRFGSSV